MNGLLTDEVTKEFSRSTISRILDMVQNASSKKAPTEKFITRFASYYTPVVVLAALALAVIPQFIAGRFSSIWVYRALLFLVISCPYALVISIPLGFLDIEPLKNGILIKGSNYLEALNNLEIIAFDKTGTLTKGIFEVTMLNPKDGFTEADLLEYAAYAEYYSNHPIAMSILDYYNKISGKIIEKSFISDFVEIPGYGVKAIIKGNKIIAGNSKLMLREGILENSTDITNAIDITDTTIMHIAVDNRYAGFVSVSDVIKSDSVNAIRSLKNMGIKRQ